MQYGFTKQMHYMTFTEIMDENVAFVLHNIQNFKICGLKFSFQIQSSYTLILYVDRINPKVDFLDYMKCKIEFTNMPGCPIW